MSENLNHTQEPKELNPKAISKMSELVTSLYMSNKEQKKHYTTQLDMLGV